MIRRDGPFALICPECGEEALIRPPTTWCLTWGLPPAYSHTDGQPLCPVMSGEGYRPAEPVELTETEWWNHRIR